MDDLDRRISIIVYADIVGYTSMMQKSEQLALLKLKHFEDAIEEQTKKHEGEVVKAYGDGCLLLFSSAVSAIKCAESIQRKLRQAPYVPLRIGIHIGEIVRKDHDVFGDGVNIASRIESMGVANSILISSDIYFQIKNHPEFKTVKIGEFSFKNIERDIPLYALSNEGLNVPLIADMKGKGRRKNGLSVFLSKNMKLVWIPLFFVLAAVFIFWVFDEKLTNNATVNEPEPGLVFASKIEANGQAIDPRTTFSQNITDLYAVFRSDMTPPGMIVNVDSISDGAYYAYLKLTEASSLSEFGWQWYRKSAGEKVLEYEMPTKGKKNLWLQRYKYSGNGLFGELGPGTYTIVILLDGNPALSSELIIESSLKASE